MVPVGDRLHRLEVTSTPGTTRPGGVSCGRWLTDRAIDRSLRRIGARASAVVVAVPLGRFPHPGTARRLLYVTDDWIDGARLMGLSTAAVSRALRHNLRRADAVLGISPPVLDRLHQMNEGRAEGVPWVVLPNGAPDVPRVPVGRRPVAALVGQLNERLDLDILRAVTDAGVTVRVIGPRSDRDVAFSTRLDEFLASSRVEWVGEVAPERIAHELGGVRVGLTPYTDTPFNRASSPLKTLEYLAAGVPVVTTDLPAARWLQTPLVHVASDATSFARAVATMVSGPAEEDVQVRCRAFAQSHGWDARAKELMELVGGIGPQP